MDNTEQKFLKQLDDKLWKAADKLRANLDAANYKHVVLGLIFLKYVSDAFEERQEQLLELFKTDDEENLYYLPRDDFDSDEEYQEALTEELEVLDYYREANVFWVPKAARWSTLKEKAVLPIGSVLWKDDSGNDVKLRSVSWLIDNALEEIEKSNSKLKGILNRISQYQLENEKLIGLINTFSDTSFTKPELGGERLNLQSKDILGHVYEYFLGQFALAEGKQGGQYYTPKSIVTLIVEMLQPYSGRVYDPAMGSGGFFVSSDKFIEEHAKEQHYDASEQRKHISVYGQESNPTTWRLAAMNMAIRGIDFNFGKKNADSFLNDQHADLRADFVMANPPFNVKDWWNESLADDARWKYGTPPKGNANFAWVQHMLHHLAPTGSMGILLANGSMSSNTNNEGEIRKRLIEEDLVECMVALPGQLFTNTQIPACIWFLTKDKANGVVRNEKKRDRRGEFLFIDARELGYMKDRVLRDFTNDDIAKVADTFHQWQQGESYEDIAGFCKSVNLDDIKKHDFVLTPGRYVGAKEQEDDGEPFNEKMARLTAQLSEQFAESERLEAEIKRNLGGLGMSCDWTLGELGKVITGKTPPKSVDDAYSESGMPFITPKDMDGSKWVLSTERYLSKSGVASVQKSVVPEGSIAVSCIGSDLGKAVRIPLSSVTNQQINTLIPDPEKCDSDYLYYLLSTMQQRFKSIAGGSATPILNKGHFSAVQVQLPELGQQRQKAHILSTIDDKIQVNKHTNQTLEQIAQAIFKSWFVDFEPVKAKMEALEAGGSEEDAILAAMQAISGKDKAQLTQLQTDNPEHYNQLRTTAELFPCAMQDSELGEIPEGWELPSFEGLVKAKQGKYQSKAKMAQSYSEDAPIPVWGGNGILGYTSKSTYSDPVVLLTCRGSNCGLIRYTESASWVSNNAFACTPKIGSVWFLLTYFNLSSFDDCISGSAQPQITYTALKSKELPFPVNKEVCYQFSKLVESLFQNILKNKKGNYYLEETRDALLPKLLSGELKV